LVCASVWRWETSVFALFSLSQFSQLLRLNWCGCACVLVFIVTPAEFSVESPTRVMMSRTASPQVDWVCVCVCVCMYVYVCICFICCMCVSVSLLCVCVLYVYDVMFVARGYGQGWSCDRHCFLHRCYVDGIVCRCCERCLSWLHCNLPLV